ncbi:MAG TPA: benzoylformate decarboxylase [Caulobacteraceae bacterium]|jgi:benzoylformate decarboxylase|nr:benzoylformate decarboxylase [Caulobacteraceae bacterium]
MTQGSTTVRDATLALLREFGMTTLFGNPGSTELTMFRNFPDDFRYVLGLQESVVLGMADGYAQATRNAAFVNLHSAVGVGHAAGNLFTAFRNQTPLVVTAGQQARSIMLYEPFLYADQATEFPKPYVKWSVEPARAEDVPAAIARAYYVAMEPPQGPVFVSVPADDWDRLCDPVTPRRVSRTVAGDAEMLADAAAALAAARRPVIVVGAGVARDQAWDEVIALAERHNAPVWVAPFSARNSFPENHRLFGGFLAASRDSIVKNLTGFDLILTLGGPLSTYHIEGVGPHTPPDAEVFQLVDNPTQAAWAPTGTSIVTHMKSGIQALLNGPQPVTRVAPAARVPAPRLTGQPMTDRYLLQQIAALRPAGSIIVEEAPSSRVPMHDYLPITEKDTFYTCSSGGLGHGLPAAIGVALGRPKDKVIAVIGDGSSLFAIQALWTAAQMKLPISFVIVKNNRYEALIHFGRLFGLQQLQGATLPEVDFCAIARGHGVPSTYVDDPAKLDAALKASFEADGPTLVEVLVD